MARLAVDPFLTDVDCPCDRSLGFPLAPVIKCGAMSDTDISAQSPCVRNCCLDDDLICLGCFRSMEEIKEWGVVDNRRRRLILQNARQRREAHRVPSDVLPDPNR